MKSEIINGFYLSAIELPEEFLFEVAVFDKRLEEKFRLKCKSKILALKKYYSIRQRIESDKYGQGGFTLFGAHRKYYEIIKRRMQAIRVNE